MYHLFGGSAKPPSPLPRFSSCLRHPRFRPVGLNKRRDKTKNLIYPYHSFRWLRSRLLVSHATPHDYWNLPGRCLVVQVQYLHYAGNGPPDKQTLNPNNECMWRSREKLLIRLGSVGKSDNLDTSSQMVSDYHASKLCTMCCWGVENMTVRERGPWSDCAETCLSSAAWLLLPKSVLSWDCHAHFLPTR
jgi:hypothetical protein